MNWVIVWKQFTRLYPHLSVDDWWGLDDPYEKSWACVLVQNTSWHNAILALNALRENGRVSVSGMIEVDDEHLQQIIRPAGFYRAKAGTLKRLAVWWERNGGIVGTAEIETERLRTELLNIRGIGEETADTLLLYVLDRRSFIGDAYTRRFVSRITGENANSYSVIREAVLATELDTHCLQRLHAYIVEFGKDVCRKREPDCPMCPFQEICNNRRSSVSSFRYYVT